MPDYQPPILTLHVSRGPGGLVVDVLSELPEEEAQQVAQLALAQLQPQPRDRAEEFGSFGAGRRR